MHGKEKVIAPVMKSAFNVKSLLPSNFNTDLFGAFTGEVERQLSPIDAARQKCVKAMRLTGLDLAVASEGSFGPHPLFGFVPLDEESLILVDLKNDLEIVAVERSMSTNFSSKEIVNEEQLLQFAKAVHFPSHGLIVRSTKTGHEHCIKGIVNKELLIRSFNELKQRSDEIRVETDMRALYNPTRMLVIEQATHKLVTKMKSTCPNCSTPGFSAERSLPGLICSQCKLPTRSIKAHIYECRKCKFSSVVEFENGKTSEDPMYCDFCNP